MTDRLPDGAADRPAARDQIGGLIFAMLLIDADGVIVEANPAAEAALGRSIKRLQGAALAQFVQLEDERVAARLSDPDAQLIARGLTLTVGERSALVNLTLSPLGTHPGWRVVTISDARQDDRSEEDRGYGSRGPAILAHEIKNPLAAIKGASQLLQKRLAGEYDELTTLIRTEVDRIAGLVDRMLSLGREQPANLTSFNLHSAIHRAHRTFTAAHSQGGQPIQILEEFDPSLPPVLADEDGLVQVLLNLMSNAADACMGQNNPQIILQTRFVSGLRAWRLGRQQRLPIECRVCDTGPGLDPALADHVFEPFVTSKPKGQGLGLALCNKLMRDMGGRIFHERDTGRGTTEFVLNLPVAGKDN